MSTISYGDPNKWSHDKLLEMYNTVLERYGDSEEKLCNMRESLRVVQSEMSSKDIYIKQLESDREIDILLLNENISDRDKKIATLKECNRLNEGIIASLKCMISSNTSSSHVDTSLDDVLKMMHTLLKS